MANPRQRRKARSSTHRPVSQSRRAKKILKKTPPIRGPKALQDAWDNRKTVRQNYLALGLVHSLDPLASGGVEPNESAPTEGTTSDAPINLSEGPSGDADKSAPLRKGYGRIIRDEAGNVIDIELPDDEADDAKDAPQDITMEDLEPPIDESTKEKWVSGMGGRLEGNGSGVVEALERISSNTKCNSNTVSASISGAGPRHASQGEIAYMKRLVAKYGQNIEQMARDRKLNPEQRTAAELRKSLRRTGLDGASRQS